MCLKLAGIDKVGHSIPPNPSPTPLVPSLVGCIIELFRLLDLQGLKGTVGK